MNIFEIVLLVFAVIIGVAAIAALGRFSYRKAAEDHEREVEERNREAERLEKEKEESLDLTSERKEILNSILSATANVDEAKDLASAIVEVFQIYETASKKVQFRYSEEPESFYSTGKARTFLERIWNPSFVEKPQIHVNLPMQRPEEGPELLPFKWPVEEWLLVITKQFSKSIQKIDRKVQVRILTAIDEIAADPVSPKGDTIKPFSHDLAGLWRYRIGDYRLVYAPVERDKKVLLLNFSARGDVYAA